MRPVELAILLFNRTPDEISLTPFCFFSLMCRHNQTGKLGRNFSSDAAIKVVGIVEMRQFSRQRIIEIEINYWCILG
jgi:hypothetical protein